MLDVIRKYFTLKIIISAVLLALVLFGVTAALVLGSKPKKSITGNATAIVNFVPAATWTPVIEQPTQSPTPSSMPGSSIPLGDISVDAYVQVSGTGGSGLRLRMEPSLEAEVRLLGGEDEVFQVKDGPQESGGYVWWYLVGPYDESRRGWAVEDFLIVTQNP